MLRKSILQIIIDLSLAIILTVIFVLMTMKITPTRNGFYCTDESIRYPYLHGDTVTTKMLLAFTFLVPLLIMSFVETVQFVYLVKRHKQKRTSEGSRPFSNWSVVRSISRLYLIFWFGLMVVGLVTEVIKLSGGRLRPHFIDVCQPDFHNINCSLGYIKEYNCSNPHANIRLITEARKSFPSGHASISLYVAVFLAYYFRRRLNSIDYSYFLNLVLQVVFITSALFTGVSRVIDYKHHWSDVIAGFIIGAFVALWMNLLLYRPLGYSDNISQGEQRYVAKIDSEIAAGQKDEDDDIRDNGRTYNYNEMASKPI